jgi:two-component system, NarL family, response regulator DevR
MSDAENQTLRVMLVDDHEIVRRGLKILLGPADDVAIVAEAESVRDAVAEAARVRPDVIVMDVRLADGSGIEATREIRSRFPGIRVLMLTSMADDDAVFASILAGASGYVLKQMRGDALVEAIREVGRGRSLLDAEVTGPLLERLRKSSHHMGDERMQRLTAQEERILSHLAQGRTNREIGETLGLSEKTIKNYVSGILGKLGATRRSEAAAYFVRQTQTPGS